MRYYIPVLVIFVLVLTGCVQPRRTTSSPIAVTNREFMTEFGEFTPPNTHWVVRVAPADRKVHVLRQTGAATTDLSPSQWRAQIGWFAYIDTDDRVWAYNGDRDLYIVEATDNGARCFDITTYPRSVPQEVR